MTNRHVTFVQHTYRNILSDIADKLPELQKELKRDYTRLCSALEKRGLPFFTIDLVDFGKHFDKCLSESRLTRFVGPHTRPYKKDSVIPRLFKGLLKRVFQDTGELVSSVDILCVRSLRQLYFAAKKLRMECENERTCRTVREFYYTDSTLKEATLSWDADCFDSWLASGLRYESASTTRWSSSQLSLPGIEPLREVPNSLYCSLHFVGDVISSLLGVFIPNQWNGKHGPGAVSDLKGKSKYDFPIWPKKLDQVFPLSEFAYANFGVWADEVISGEIEGRFRENEPYSKLIAVPKTQKAPRLIASEPTAHQWCQQLVKSYLTERLERTPLKRIVHFRDQSFNQALARQASMSQSHWTIDLSAASDRVSCWVVERFFRRNPSLLEAFHACRTRLIYNNIDRKSPRISRLRKFSCMGSALTFPVQSIIFSGVVLACLLYKRGMPYTIASLDSLSREVLVFGDDLIVPEDVGYLVLGLLRCLGFEVNHNKTFGKGNFRESCGGEYYKGHDVTPTYLLSYPVRQRPESVVSCIETRNNFFRSGYSLTAEYLKSTVVRASKVLIPSLPYGSGRLCWETDYEVSYSGLKTKLDKDTHSRVYRAHALISRVAKYPDRVGSRLLQYFTERPLPHLPWKSGVNGRPKLSLRLRWEPVPY